MILRAVKWRDNRNVTFSYPTPDSTVAEAKFDYSSYSQELFTKKERFGKVVIRFAWLYHPNQMKAMTEIENMNKEREILKQIHSREQERKNNKICITIITILFQYCMTAAKWAQVLHHFYTQPPYLLWESTNS